MTTTAPNTDIAETALMISVAQILDGSPECIGCKNLAHFTVSTGADPEPEPMCYEHMVAMMLLSQRSAAFIADAPGGRPGEMT